MRPIGKMQPVIQCKDACATAKRQTWDANDRCSRSALCVPDSTQSFPFQLQARLGDDVKLFFMRVLHFSDKAHRIVNRALGEDGLHYLPGRLEVAETDPQEIAFSILVDVDFFDGFNQQKNLGRCLTL